MVLDTKLGIRVYLDIYDKWPSYSDKSKLLETHLIEYSEAFLFQETGHFHRVQRLLLVLYLDLE